MIEKNILYVERNWVSAYQQTSILRNQQGQVVKIITNPLQQPQKPRKKNKTAEITIKGKVYQLKFM